MIPAPRRPHDLARRNLQRWLPAAWRGDGRQARWRRSRGRRVLAGLLCGAAVLVVAGAVRPSQPPTMAVMVAARDLPAGRRLVAADVREVRWSRSDRVPGALSAREAADAVLTAPIRAGEPLTATRVRTARTWPFVPAGRVIIAVPAADGTLAGMLRPGDRIDLIDTGRSVTVASYAPVLSVVTDAATARATGLGPTSGGGSDVLVSVTSAEAVAVGAATADRSGSLGGGIQVALRTGD